MRARNIKPGFFKNESLAECSPWARLCFIGLWTLADREGRLEDRPKRIKGELFAFDSVEVEGLLQELVACGFILRYRAGERDLIQIIQFTRHQHPHHREPDSELPPPIDQKPRAFGSCNDLKAQGQPEADGACDDIKAQGKPRANVSGKPPKASGKPRAGPGVARGSSPVDSGLLIPDSGELNPESARAGPPPPPARAHEGQGPEPPKTGGQAPATTPPPHPPDAGPPDPEPPPSTTDDRPPPSTNANLVARARVGQALRRAGVDPTKINLADPRLLALLERGATPDSFEGVAREAVEREIASPMGWICAALAGRMQEAEAGANGRANGANGHHGASAWRRTTEGVFAMGRQLGVKSRDGELFHELERRVLSVWQRSGEPALQQGGA